MSAYYVYRWFQPPYCKQLEGGLQTVFRFTRGFDRKICVKGIKRENKIRIINKLILWRRET